VTVEERFERLVDGFVGAALVTAGEGVRFDANKGTPMKEWFALDPASEQAWLPLAQEALEFVGQPRT
jgi:hypothetical protein